MNTDQRIKRTFDDRDSIFTSRIGRDEFLTAIGRSNPSHAFLANSIQAVYGRQIKLLTALLLETTGRDPGSIKVLDWGCGKGHISYLLRREGFDTTSCDMDRQEADSSFGQEAPILDALRIPVIPLLDPVRLPFKDALFDAVVSFGVLEHVQSDRGSLGEIRRVLNTGGVFYVVFLPYLMSWTQAVGKARGINYHDRLYTRTGVRHLAADAGFTVLGMRHAQLFPKNSIPIRYDRWLDPLDRFLCECTPLKYLATNLELIMVANL